LTKTNSCPSIKYKYSFCDESFPSRTKFFKYFKNTKPDYNRKKKSLDLINKLIQEYNLQEIISSVLLLSIRTGLGYHNYMYLIIYLCLTKDGPINTTCWDTGCNALFIDCSWLKKILPGSEIRIIITALIVKGIKSNSYDTNEYIILNLRVPSYNRKSTKPTKIILRYEFYIIDKFLANILIGINVIVP
jgi:hypothetical protein